MTGQQPLAGIRVLDFTRVLAGPTCSMLLGDLGAEVIKVEHPGLGDDTRHWGPPWAGEGRDQESAYFLSVNRNKRSLTLNLKSEAGQEIARKLAASSHILIENFKLGQMDGFGLGYEQLKVINPALIYCSITGFGQSGEYRERPGYDYVIQAMSGLMSITGPADGEPHKVGVAISDVIAGLFAYGAVLAALRKSERTGEGQHLDVALLDSQIAALVNVASNYLVSGQVPPRLGNLHPNIVPYQTFRAADGEFVMAVGNDKQFRLLCELIDQVELAEDARFATNPARVDHRETLVALLQAIFEQRSRAEWIEQLLATGIPAGPINNVAEALNDPHVKSRHLIQHTTLANGTDLQLVGPPVRLSGAASDVRFPPPALGQHTDELLRELLDFDEETIRQYHQQGIV